MNDLKNAPLGKDINYASIFDKDILFKIPRTGKRLEIKIDPDNLPFYGVDLWHAYEISWLNAKGKPCVAIGQISIPADSPYIVESKSLKLYLNSFNQARIDDMKVLQDIIAKDLSDLLAAEVTVVLMDTGDKSFTISKLPGENIDHLDVECKEYDSVNVDLLKCSEEIVSQELNSNLLKSNCLITNQPDFASLYIKYTGKKIDKASLVQYITSFRMHNEFHEQCIERIFVALQNLIEPTELLVYGLYTRRGGIDICPFRSLSAQDSPLVLDRLSRQ